ncbi:copper homeostasis protein CutC [Rhizobium sp. RAF56]|jgi:copper homeostasis protein|uniref:copper homeostasis protein CutC n=1 Tax=Rhizobium sp. RAF56 TaxID=3233062 RepID=UPI003F9A5176
MRLEVCVDDIAGLHAAVEGGADRIELCIALSLGGLTPGPGLMAAAARHPVPAYAMIRPRAGDFRFSSDELEIMKGDIDAVRRAGLAGVVLGASLVDGSLDVEMLEVLATHAEGLGKTLHRAFDLVPDPIEAIEIAVRLGFERILTSGGERSAAEGIEALERAIALASGRISIMPGSGINLQTIEALVPRLAVSEIHASCSVAAEPADIRAVTLGFAPANARRTSAATVRALKAALPH